MIPGFWLVKSYLGTDTADTFPHLVGAETGSLISVPKVPVARTLFPREFRGGLCKALIWPAVLLVDE